MGKWIDCLFERHKFTRRFSIFSGWALMWYIAHKIFDPMIMPHISAPIGSIAVALVGVFATSVGLYQRSRGKDDERK